MMAMVPLSVLGASAVLLSGHPPTSGILSPDDVDWLIMTSSPRPPVTFKRFVGRATVQCRIDKDSFSACRAVSYSSPALRHMAATIVQTWPIMDTANLEGREVRFMLEFKGNCIKVVNASQPQANCVQY